MLQHSIDAADPMTTAPAVMRRHNRLQNVAPVSWAVFILWIEFGQRGITPGFFQPQLQLGFVRIKPDGRSGIRTADALFTYGQPLLTRQLFSPHQA